MPGPPYSYSMKTRFWSSCVWDVLCPLALGCIAAVNIGAGAEPPARELTPAMIADFGGEKHVTRASQDATMGFSQPTRVTDVLVKGGQSVKAGDLLVRGEDAEETGRVRLQKIQANSDLSIQRAQRTADLAKLEYEKFQEAGKKGAAPAQEIDRARLTWEGADIDVLIAKMQKEQEVITVGMAQARLDRLQIKAPFDGQIDAVLYDVGQSLSETDKILRIVSIDPLYIDVPVPTEKVLQLKIKNGDPAWVLMQLPGEPGVYVGKVREVAPTADSASATVRVRVEVPNPARIIAGLAAWVRFEEPAGVWRERVLRPPATAAAADSAKAGAGK